MARPAVQLYRSRLALAIVLTVAAGLGVNTRGTGAVADVTGDALYAVLFTLLIAFAAPRAPLALVGALALGWCSAIEFAQLTGIPAALVAAWGPLHYLLGTTFHARDLVAYALGVALTLAALRLVHRAAAPPRTRARTGG